MTKKSKITINIKHMSHFLKFCFYINLLLIIQVISTFFASLLSINEYLTFSFYNQSFNIVRSIASAFTFILWIFLLVIWSKRDRQIGRFFLLFFLIGTYTLFYYRIAKKKNWLN